MSKRRASLQHILQSSRTRLSKGSLNSHVSELANNANRRGLKGQITFLLSKMPKAKLVELLTEVIATEREIDRLTDEALTSGQIVNLLKLMYDCKIKEAHQLAHLKPRQVVRYLVNELGLDKVRLTINKR